MSVSFVNFAESGFNVTATSFALTTLTISAANTRALIVKICEHHSTLPAGFTVTWGAQTLQLIDTFQTNSGTGPCCTIWGLINPAVGNQTLTISWTSSIQLVGYVGAEVYSGVDQTGGTTSFANFTLSDTTASSSGVTVSSAVGDLVTAFAVNASGAFTGAASPATEIWQDFSQFNNVISAYNSGASSTTVTFNSGTSQENTVVGFSLTAADDATPQNENDFVLCLVDETAPPDTGLDYVETFPVDNYNQVASLIQAILSFFEEIWDAPPTGHVEANLVDSGIQYVLAAQALLSFLDPADVFQTGHEEAFPLQEQDLVPVLPVPLSFLEEEEDPDQASSNFTDSRLSDIFFVFAGQSLLSFLDPAPEPGLDHGEEIPIDNMVVVFQATLVQAVLSFLDQPDHGSGTDYIDPRLVDISMAALSAATSISASLQGSPSVNADLSATSIAALSTIARAINSGNTFSGQTVIHSKAYAALVVAAGMGGKTYLLDRSGAFATGISPFSAVSQANLTAYSAAAAKAVVAGASSLQAKAKAVRTAVASMSGRSLSQTRGEAISILIGLTLLAARGAIAVGGLAKAGGRVSLAATSSVTGTARTAMLQTLLLRATATMLSTGKSAASAVTGLAAKVSSIVTSTAGFAVFVPITLHAMMLATSQGYTSLTGKVALGAKATIISTARSSLSGLVGLAASTRMMVAAKAATINGFLLSAASIIAASAGAAISTFQPIVTGAGATLFRITGQAAMSIFRPSQRVAKIIMSSRVARTENLNRSVSAPPEDQ